MEFTIHVSRKFFLPLNQYVGHASAKDRGAGSKPKLEGETDIAVLQHA